ncbi:hypothetical protein [Burkholderia sp. MBR-1]|uniref:hypothetical protein n=1 Tax=Burkholderia sp. MBR-1 TaxID=2732364 RepID=UPI0015EEDA34|nr:hypothetical protein [Burkholderia sp. MBR-1]QMI49719.1 hypothetical protein MBR110_30045 [Burkholderia sp. MBR-1]
MLRQTAARWIEEHTSRECSELGASVAGILHAAAGHLKDAPIKPSRVNWESTDEVMVTWSAALANWDRPDLSVLHLLCRRLGLALEVAGVAPGRMTLAFVGEEYEDHQVPTASCLARAAPIANSLLSSAGQCSALGHTTARVLDEVLGGQGDAVVKPERVDWSAEERVLVTWYGRMSARDNGALDCLIRATHRDMIRVELEGIAPGKMRVSFSQRFQRTGQSGSRLPEIREMEAIVEERVKSAGGLFDGEHHACLSDS